MRRGHGRGLDKGLMNVDLSYRSFTLPNGLQVHVHEDHALPIVAVNTWFLVGSKDERPGRTGFAHLFEHLMFEGSQHVPPGRFDELLEGVGAANNGSTNEDRTNYWETLPANALELALYLDADRTGWLAQAMTQDKLDGQRDVVKNERRQSYENRPYGLAFETILAALYPPSHPYHWPTIGSMADLDAASLDDVLDFCRTYYTPGNALLSVAGDVTFAEVRRLVERYYGEIPPGPVIPVATAPSACLDVDRHEILEDDVQLPRLYLAWHTPGRFQNGDAELDLAASILGEGKVSRLFRTLVYEREMAQDVSAFQSSALLASSFYVVVTARPERGLTELEAEVRTAIRALAEEVEERELQRARNGIITAYVDALETVGGFGGKADRLNDYAYYTGDPGYASADLARYTHATLATVQSTVATCLRDTPAVLLSVVPRGRLDLAVGGSA